MTESEWLACTDSDLMQVFLLRGKASDRKLRLFACACCRGIWHLLTDERSRRAVEVAEQFADGAATNEKLGAAWATSQAARAAWAAGDTAGFAWIDAPARADWPVDQAADRAAEIAAICATWATAGKTQCDLLRDIFGNPFLPSPALPPAVLAWGDGTVRRIAQGIYDERALPSGELGAGRLAILADALLDAGCDDEELIQHCRGAGPHVRGCWAVDLLLGRQ